MLKVFQTGTLAGNVPRCVHANCHLNGVGKFEFTMTLKLMSSGVFGHYSLPSTISMVVRTKKRSRLSSFVRKSQSGWRSSRRLTVASFRKHRPSFPLVAGLREQEMM